jgi:hypothetical protein
LGSDPFGSRIMKIDLVIPVREHFAINRQAQESKF